MIRSIEKRSGTYADDLEAIGWASLMSEHGVKQVEITDDGWCFTVHGKGEIQVDSDPKLGFWFVADEKNPPPKIADWSLDYAAERAKEEAQREFQKATKTAKKKKRGLEKAAEEGDLQLPDPPKPELKLAKMISSMRKGWNADRELAVWANEHPEEFRNWIDASLKGLPYGLGPGFSNSQLLNPTTGKGVSASKTQAKSPNSLPSVLVDPFAEWMKLRGLWQGMIAYRSGEDFKFMVLEPAGISLGGLNTLRRELEALNLYGGVRLDIEATLRLTVILIINSEVLQKDAKVSLTGRTPRSVVGGLRQAYFKSLGTAAALMNEALLPLPGWFQINDREDASAYLRIIEEAIGISVRGGCLGILDEEKSDEGSVLQQYRSWLATGAFEELMDFHHDFGILMLRKAAAGDYTRQFNTELLDELLIRTYEKEHMVKEIIQNSGFRNLARAVRNTTIYAVGIKNSKREVRFGLAQKWKQSIKQGGGEFSIELAEFVQANNWEIVQKLAGLGFQVTTADLDEVFKLIEVHGEAKIGALLLAYGFSRAPKSEGENQNAEETAA
jgi:hypothetical protein